jgi:hypothetical protein
MMIDAAGYIEPDAGPSLMKVRDQFHNGFSAGGVIDRILIHSVLAPACLEKPTPFGFISQLPRCAPRFDDLVDVAHLALLLS